MPRLNRKLVIQKLEETVEHIETVITEIKKGKTNMLEIYIPFIYLDLNRAWNARFLTDKQYHDAGAEYDQYPGDVDLSVPELPKF